jgi:tetratricopeptide (TPR) repeat protein
MNGRPSNYEIERQLDRILKSEKFTRSPALSQFLRFAVESDLRDRKISEAIIAREVFGREPDDDQHFVRVNASHLRDALAEYYESASDLIRITGPEGRGYRPTFSYNPQSEAELAYRVGLQVFEKGFYGNHVVDSSGLELLLEDEPGHAQANAAVGLARIYFALYGRGRFTTGQKRIASARELAEESIRLNPRLCMAHIALGAVCCCQFKWSEAKSSFDTALKLDRAHTSAHPVYLVFLAAIGKSGNAFKLAEARFSEEPSALASTMLAMLCLIERADFVTFHYLCWAHDLDASFWPADIVHYLFLVSFYEQLIDLAKNDPRREFASDGWKHIFPGLYILLRRIKDNESSDAEYQRLIRGWRMWGLKDPEVAQTFELENGEPSSASAWELALAHLAYGKHDEAIKALEQAMDDNHPFTIWLHLWPFLDPLRKYEGFDVLIRRLGLDVGLNAPADATT